MAFNESTIVITGGSRGIGRQIALAFARLKKHPILLLARDEQALQKVKDECVASGASRAEYRMVNLEDSAQIEQLDWPDGLPDCGILINNAGNFLLKPLQVTSGNEFMDQWKIHAWAPFLLTNKLLPRMKQLERGLIVNIASLGALSGQSRSGAYSSAKHALLGFSRSLRRELYQTGIAVTAINLGQTMSSSWEGIEVESGDLIDPVDVAELIVQLTRFSPQTVTEEITIRPQRGDRSPD